MKTLVLLLINAFFFLNTYAQVNAPLLHQLVGDSKAEHSRQQKVTSEQGKVVGVEEVNRNMLKKVKNKYRILQQRFAKLGFFFDAAFVGMTATPLVKEIVANQQRIVEIVLKKPSLARIALETEVSFVDKSNSLMNYLLGLYAVVGDLNQMKASDRRMLFQYVLNELKDIAYLSNGLARSMCIGIIKIDGVDPLSDYMQREKRLVDEIMNNTRTLLK